MTCRASRSEGAEESRGAAEQRHQVLKGRRDVRRWSLELLVQPFVQTFGKAAGTSHFVYPRPAEDFLFEAGGLGATACHNR